MKNKTLYILILVAIGMVTIGMYGVSISFFVNKNIFNTSLFSIGLGFFLFLFSLIAILKNQNNKRNGKS